jgi:hypothetical protein
MSQNDPITTCLAWSGAVAYTFTWEEIGTSMIIGIRTVVDPTNPEE